MVAPPPSLSNIAIAVLARMPPFRRKKLCSAGRKIYCEPGEVARHSIAMCNGSCTRKQYRSEKGSGQSCDPTIDA
jgi:hypothetical protein